MKVTTSAESRRLLRSAAEKVVPAAFVTLCKIHPQISYLRRAISGGLRINRPMVRV